MFWKEAQARARAAGALFILDENKTGFRLAVPGAHAFYGLEPDMLCYGKAMANGFSVSALAGRAEILDQGGIYQTDRDRVFLLSATHGGETHALAAALKTVEIMRKEPVIQSMWKTGTGLTAAISTAAERAGVSARFVIQGYGCFPTLRVQNAKGEPDTELRTLFLQEMSARGVLCNFFAPAYTHDDAAVYQGKRLRGPSVRPVFRRKN